MTRTDLISPEYLETQKWLHAQPRGYGAKGDKWAPMVLDLVSKYVPIDAVLDFGCGQNSLAVRLNRNGIRTRSYDPAIPEFSELPIPTDFVTACDVMEHVEPAKIATVIECLRALTKKYLFVVISLAPTSKLLPDGRNAHISLHDKEWWALAFSAKFAVIEEFDARSGKHWCALLSPRG